MNSETRDVSTAAYVDIISQLYHTGYLTQGHRINNERKMVPKTINSGISQNQFLSWFNKFMKGNQEMQICNDSSRKVPSTVFVAWDHILNL